MILTEGMGWTVHLWTGTAVMAGLAGVLVSFLVTGLAPDGQAVRGARGSAEGWNGPTGADEPNAAAS